MKKIQNTQGIKMIIMKPVAYAVCEIGGDMYESKLTISLCPRDCYPDYTEIQQWIMKNIDGKKLNIEDVVNILYKMLEDEFCPLEMEINSDVDNCRTHFDVTVIK